MERVDQVIKLNPSIIVLSVGGNDLMSDILDHNFPESLSFSNLTKILSALTKASAIVVQMGLVIIDHETELPAQEARRLPLFEYIVNKFDNTLFVPNIMNGFWENEAILFDSLHPNDEGYRIICKRLVDKIVTF